MLHILHLPDELLVHILGFLTDSRDLTNTSKVCTILYRLAFDRYSTRSLIIPYHMLNLALKHDIQWVILSAKDFNYCLDWASYYGHTATVALLLDRGADIHARDDAPLRLASENGHTSTVQILLLDHGANIHAWDDRSLRLASDNGHTATVALLLDRGADIHTQDDAPLRWASENGHTATIALLLDHGASPSV